MRGLGQANAMGPKKSQFPGPNSLTLALVMYLAASKALCVRDHKNHRPIKSYYVPEHPLCMLQLLLISNKFNDLSLLNWLLTVQEYRDVEGGRVGEQCDKKNLLHCPPTPTSYVTMSPSPPPIDSSPRPQQS